jgi:hypothetical protein
MLVDHIKIDLIDRGLNGTDWIDLAQDRIQWTCLLNTVMNIRVPENAGKFLSSCRIGGFARTQFNERGVRIGEVFI